MKKMLIALTIFAASLGLTLGLPAFVSAQTTTQLKDAACMGAGGTTGCTDSGDPNDPNSATSQINRTIATVINVLSVMVGVAAVIMIIIGGFKYITSNGDSGNVNSAKNTILYAIVGLVVVALAQFIVRFVLTKV